MPCVCAGPGGGSPRSPPGTCWGSGESLGAGEARSLHLPGAGAAPRAAAGARAPPGAAREPGRSLGGMPCGTWRGPAGPGPNLGQAWGRPGLRLCARARRAGRETSFKSYLNGRAHRGASKQLAFGAQLKYSIMVPPSSMRWTCVDSGSAPGGQHHGHLRVWGNHLPEGLDDVRSRCDFFFSFYQVKTTHESPRPARPRSPDHGASPRGRPAAEARGRLAPSLRHRPTPPRRRAPT